MACLAENDPASPGLIGSLTIGAVVNQVDAKIGGKE